MAKAATWPMTDAEARKLGERTGLDTPVVPAVNDVDQVWGVSRPPCRSSRMKSTAWGVRPQG